MTKDECFPEDPVYRMLNCVLLPELTGELYGVPTIWKSVVLDRVILEILKEVVPLLLIVNVFVEVLPISTDP